jgi:uncharacterized protein YbjT (DUF2867 family)
MGASARLSQNRHASHHAQETGHPIVTSLEPGEDWSYCYVDDVAFVLEGRPIKTT